MLEFRVRQLLGLWILVVSLSVQACKLQYIEYESFFAAGSGSLSSEEGEGISVHPMTLENLITAWCHS